MKLVKDFMGHDLVLLSEIITTEFQEDLFCKRCKIRIYPDGSDNLFYYKESGWMKMITCEEMIIKNIIE